MKVKLNTNKRINNKQNYYDNLRNLLERIDDNMEKTKLNKEERIDNEAKEEIIVSELIQTSSDNKKKVICAICNKDEFKYICPKCKVKYCSVKCFKEHNLDCTENFYKKCVEEELKSTKIEDKEKKSFKKNIQNIFSKQAQEDEIYDKEKLKEINQPKINHLEDILSKLNNNSLDLEKDLSKEDWESFAQFMNGFSTGNLVDEVEGGVNDKDNNVNLIRIWKPFWEAKLSNGFEPNLNAYDNNLLYNLDQASKQKLKDFELNEFLEYFSDEKDLEDEKENKFDFGEMKDIAEEIAENVEDFNDFLNPHQAEEKEFNPMEEKIQMITLNNKKVRIDRNLIYMSILLKYENISNLNGLSKTAPSDKNLFTLVDLMLNMAYLCRLYNGELSDNNNILDIIAYYNQNLKVLYDKSVLYENVLEVLNKFKLYISTYEKKNSDFILELAIKDLVKIIQNKFYIIECLFRIYEVIHKFLKEFKGDLNKFNDDKSDTNDKKYQELIKNLMLAKHKILYFLSYVKGVNNEKLEGLIKVIKSAVKENEEINAYGAKLKTYLNTPNNY